MVRPLFALLFLFVCSALAAPYPLKSGWSYYLALKRGESKYPACDSHMLSYNKSLLSSLFLRSDESVDGLRIGQIFTVMLTAASSIQLKLTASHSLYLAYSVDCSDRTTISAAANGSAIATLNNRGLSTHWQFTSTDLPFGSYHIFAADRRHCAANYLAAPSVCSPHGQPDTLLFSEQAAEWRLVPAAPPSMKKVSPNVPGTCPDPFMWYNETTVLLTCTGQSGIPLFKTNKLAVNGSTTLFTQVTDNALGLPYASWCAQDQRWAPESLRLGNITVMALCDMQQTGGPHRIGTVVGSVVTSPYFTTYSPTYYTLSPGVAGDIDPHFFVDPVSGSTFLFWKSDDNRLNPSGPCRLWAQEITISPLTGEISLLQDPTPVFNSTVGNLWWIKGYATNGTLVEGPEVVYRRGYYYLFFATGRIGDASYAEGVVRSKHVLGPYRDVMPVPFISSGMMGMLNVEGFPRLEGPGHAGFLWSQGVVNGGAAEQGDQLFAVFHAHVRNQPRVAFLTEVDWDESGWPVARLSQHF